MKDHRYFPKEGLCSGHVDYRPQAGLLSNLKQPSNLLFHHLPRIHFQLIVIFTLTHSLHFFLFNRLLLPKVVSQIMAGIILGPTILGCISGFEEILFPISGEIFLDLFSKFGFIFFIFLCGVKMDPKMISKAGWKEWNIGVAATILPSIIGYFLWKTFKELTNISRWKTITYVITSHSFVSFPMAASVLVHLRIINTELGHLVLSSSLISNMIILFIHVLAYAGQLSEVGLFYVVQDLLAYVILLLYIFVIVRPLSHRIIKKTQGSDPVERRYMMLIVILVFTTVLLADYIGIPYELASFLVGLFGVPDGPPLGSSLVEKLETLVDGLLAPLMVSYCGTKVNIFRLYDLKFIRTLWILAGCCLVMKVISFLLPALVVKVPPRDAFTLALVMSSEGIIQMSSHSFLLTIEVFDEMTFTTMVLSVLLNAAITQVLAKLTYNYSFTYTGYKKRTIQHDGVNGELKILPCIYRLDDVLSMRKLFEVSILDEKNSVSISVINLVELVGRATPQLIEHKFDQKVIHSRFPHSQELFDYFADFELKYRGLVHVQFFSAISMFKVMHQDICSLAFKQSVSLIILPFHRKWNHQGKVVLDNHDLRVVNSNVLKMSPCSVAILIHRQKFHRSSSIPTSSYNVGVIFIGGADDIEALSYGKRMAKSPRVHLRVVHTVSEMNASVNLWDEILDAEALRELKMGGNGIEYRKEVVESGIGTAVLVHELRETCDLVLVGRRHKDNIPQLSGLTEWNEFPELGSIGDIIATSDTMKPLSLLVLQQQTIKPNMRK